MFGWILGREQLEQLYVFGQGLSFFSSAPSFYFCQETEMNTQCPAGYHCPEGTAVFDTSQTSSLECGSGKASPAAWYCPEGSATPVAVTNGHYTVNGNGDATVGQETKRAAHVIAGLGHYASLGVLIACPAGSESSFISQATSLSIHKSYSLLNSIYLSRVLSFFCLSTHGLNPQSNCLILFYRLRIHNWPFHECMLRKLLCRVLLPFRIAKLDSGKLRSSWDCSKSGASVLLRCRRVLARTGRRWLLHGHPGHQWGLH